MRLKQHIITVASTATLRQMVHDYELAVGDKRQRKSLADAISSARRCTPEELLGYLTETEVKQVCEETGVDPKGRKNALIARLLEAASPASPPAPTPSRIAQSRTINQAITRRPMSETKLAQESLQLTTPDDKRGRVSSVNSMFINSSNELGQFESGFMSRALGTVPSVIFGGCMTLLVVIATWFKAPGLRKFEY